MTYVNPFIAQHSKTLAALEETRAQQENAYAELDWFQNFDHAQEIKNTSELDFKLKSSMDLLQQEAKVLKAKQTSYAHLKKRAGLGVDPRYWFSAERKVAKRALLVARREELEIDSRVNTLNLQIHDLENVVLHKYLDLERHRVFDIDAMKESFHALSLKKQDLERQASHLEKLKEALDLQLLPLLQEFAILERRQKDLDKKIADASRMMDELHSAQNSKERAMIHHECEGIYGEGNPNRIVFAAKGELRGVSNNIRKIEERIKKLIEFAERDVRVVVIDGNNLCYEGDKFIGLAALEAIVPMLVDKHEVVLVFDSGIRNILKMNKEAIQARFPMTKCVHIVSDREAADETILDSAGSDKYTYVISRDKYAEYPEKRAVFERRLISHEIVHGYIHIHALGLSAAYGVSGTA